MQISVGINLVVITGKPLIPAASKSIYVYRFSKDFCGTMDDAGLAVGLGISEEEVRRLKKRFRPKSYISSD